MNKNLLSSSIFKIRPGTCCRMMRDLGQVLGSCHSHGIGSSVLPPCRIGPMREPSRVLEKSTPLSPQRKRSLLQESSLGNTDAQENGQAKLPSKVRYTESIAHSMSVIRSCKEKERVMGRVGSPWFVHSPCTFQTL